MNEKDNINKKVAVGGLRPLNCSTARNDETRSEKRCVECDVVLTHFISVTGRCNSCAWENICRVSSQ